MERYYWERSAVDFWTPIKECPDYEVSTYGEIRKIDTKKRVRTWLNQRGYLVCKLRNKNGDYRHYYIHHLVAEAWVPNEEGKPTLGFIDSDRCNVSAVNLVWETKSESMLRTRKEDRHRYGVYDLSTGTFYESAKQAAKDIGGEADGVRACCNGKIKSYRGHVLMKLSNDY